ncbi:MAG TPA: TetR family transcriptional regulator [Acidimicrobiia bacterium]|nr:TetR family transcriptional regulator [Acidimicrobiia bacterium]
MSTRTTTGPTRVRDPEGTRRKILAAALQEFSAKGIDGARVDAIAARAGVNKQLLYYYFESKAGLFRAVLRERLAERAPEAAAADRTGPSRLADLQDRLAAAPDWIRLLMWEALEHSGRSAVEQAAIRRGTLQQWIEAVEAAQADGALPADLDARQFVLSELGAVLFPLAFPQLTRLVTGRSPTSPEFLAERRAFLEEFGTLLTR